MILMLTMLLPWEFLNICLAPQCLQNNLSPLCSLLFQLYWGFGWPAAPISTSPPAQHFKTVPTREDGETGWKQRSWARGPPRCKETLPLHRVAHKGSHRIQNNQMTRVGLGQAAGVAELSHNGERLWFLNPGVGSATNFSWFGRNRMY